MISPEILRRYPYFAGVDADGLVFLARSAQELTAEAGDYFFREGDALDKMYLVVEGEVEIVATLPGKGREIVISTVSPGEIFAWSGLVPPYQATSAAKAKTICRVIAFDCPQLRARFDAEPALGYVMMLRLAQVMRDRIRDMRMETIACMAD